jgi:hypothetical protein
MDDAERMAFVVVLGRLSGLEFDWRQLRWMD